MSAPAPRAALRFTALAVPLQAALAVTAVLLGAWAGLPWPGSVGLAMLGAGAMIAGAQSAFVAGRLRASALAAGWAGTAAFVAAALLRAVSRGTVSSYFDSYYVALAWMVAASLLPACGWRRGGGLTAGWRLLVVLWAMLGSLAWLGASYVQDRSGAFYSGLLIVLALLVLCHLWLRLNAPAVVAVNTLILLLIGLPVLDVVVRSAGYFRSDLDAHRQYYLYAVAKRSPATFARWWNYYIAQWRQAQKQVYMPDPDPFLEYRLRPHAQGRLVQSTFSINALGFRGRDIPLKKGDAYRIVALGESTTFGVTLNREDRPWPELLERMIQERLKPSRPVQVINAGIPGYRLDQNLRRFARDILPLQPAMIISYHGINAFDMLRDAVPFAPGARAPAYKDRPLRVLADAEYRLKLLRFQHRRPAAHSLSARAPRCDPLATPYARFYRDLIQLAETNHIRLVLANHSLAANERSEPPVVEFFQIGYPAARWQIKANRVHSSLVQMLAAQHPAVIFVDTHPQLDGEHDKFVDFVHFAPAGEQQMAETFFSALRPILTSDLSTH